MERAAKMAKATHPTPRPASHLGVSPPISVAGPEALDLRLTASLQQWLSFEGLGEAEEKFARVRQTVLRLLRAFVHAVALSEGLTAEQAADAGGAVLTLGSHALGAATPAADIDLLAAVPYFVEPSHFFARGGLDGQLRECPDVHALHALPDAFVPVVKFVLYGVHVDLLLARLRLPQVAHDLSPSTSKLLHRCMGEADVNSLNGVRVAAAILSLVPQREHFRCTLQAVKLWAQRRAINHSLLGFLGGVGWAMLTARVCQLYPNAVPSTLLARFFSTWSQWKFGDVSLPVLLHPSDPTGDAELPSHFAALDWNPQNARDRQYVMQVITPCRPRICSTHAVCKSTLAVLKREFARAATVTAAATQAAARHGETSPEPWAELFEPIDFFSLYKGFVVTQLSADTQQQLVDWCGWVKSRIRRLVVALERQPAVETVHPLAWPLAVAALSDDESHATTPSKCISFFIGVSFVRGAAERVGAVRQVDLRPCAAEFVSALQGWERKTELCPSARVEVRYTRKSQLPCEVLGGPTSLPFVNDQDRVAVCRSTAGLSIKASSDVSLLESQLP
ncbi:hypothetical protein AB1Y20_006892 [Prymnesium parvum]|uniref:Poly(A) polymerase n=1 Tax=Prymnesium parvum TaxID=97485 RepID=A0AB34J1Z6_PRYPA